MSRVFRIFLIYFLFSTPFYFIDYPILLGNAQFLIPTTIPTAIPTPTSTPGPSQSPILIPSPIPTLTPTQRPSESPTLNPTPIRTPKPTQNPTFSPTAPTSAPTDQPTRRPSGQPTSKPSIPTGQPTSAPSNPTNQPTSQPTRQPISKPSGQPTAQPFSHPSTRPTSQPTSQPTNQPNSRPSSQPSVQPTSQPNSRPSSQPSVQPTSQPSSQPFSQPSVQPTSQPNSRPSSQPSVQPSSQPSSQPSVQPTPLPTTPPTNVPSYFIAPFPSFLKKSLVAYYPCDSNLAKDASGENNHGVNHNTHAVADRFGLSNNAISFNGFSSYISVLNGFMFTFSCELTVSMWVKPGSNKCQYAGILDKSHAKDYVFSGWVIERSAFQPNSYYFAFRQDYDWRFTSEFILEKSFWNHVAIAKNETSMTVYLNGVAQQTTSYSNCLISDFVSNALYMGAQISSDGSFYRHWNGSLDDLFFFNRSLSESEIMSLYSFQMPTSQPSGYPTMEPTNQPISAPTSQPSSQPSAFPTIMPLACPTTMPTMQPTSFPTSQPTRYPTNYPTVFPSSCPTVFPTMLPSPKPSCLPSSQPSSQPSYNPTVHPSAFPSGYPSESPSSFPSPQPSSTPTNQPTSTPSVFPTVLPSFHPTARPSMLPTALPTSIPSNPPTGSPSGSPTNKPRNPTISPSVFPSVLPTSSPMHTRTSNPTFAKLQPTCRPSVLPKTLLTSIPSNTPYVEPSNAPTTSFPPSAYPSVFPSNIPSSIPFAEPSRLTNSLSKLPSMEPLALPTAVPTDLPSASPTSSPFRQLTEAPSSSSLPSFPSQVPSVTFRLLPTSFPNSFPSFIPTQNSSDLPTSLPTWKPSWWPSAFPSAFPKAVPSTLPSNRPSTKPSGLPSNQPNTTPSSQPTTQPTKQPTSRPSCSPTEIFPFTNIPTPYPSPSSPTIPTPTVIPTYAPSIAPSNTITVKSTMSTSFQGNLFSFGSMYTGSASVLNDIPLPMNSFMGSSYVVFGRPRGFHNISLVGNPMYQDGVMSIKNGGLIQDSISRSSTIIGDINGDKVQDLLIGDPLSSRCFVLFGSSDPQSYRFSNLRVAFSITVNQSTSSVQRTNLGWSAAALGDMNNDNRDDFIITATIINTAYVVFGQKRYLLSQLILSQMTSRQGYKIVGSSGDRFFGMSVSSAGDFNGDGYRDIVISALRVGSSSQSCVYVLLSSITKTDIYLDRFSNDSYYRISSSRPAYYGLSVAGVGDINGDGFDDVGMGSSSMESGSVVEKTAVIYGRSSSFTSNRIDIARLGVEDGFTIMGGGFQVHGLGDVNQDGFSDMMVVSYTGWLGKRNAYITVFPENVTLSPTMKPSLSPSLLPSMAPTATVYPSSLPSVPSQSFPPNLPQTSRPSRVSYTPSIRPTIGSKKPSLRPSLIPSVFPTFSPTFRPSSLSPSFAPSSRRPSIRPTKVRAFPSSYPTSFPTGSGTSPIQEILVEVSGTFIPPDGAKNLIIAVNGSLVIEASRGKTMYSVLPSPCSLTLQSFRNDYDVLNLTAFSEYNSLGDLKYSIDPLTLAMSSSQKIVLPSHANMDLMTSSVIFAASSASSSSLSAVSGTRVNVGALTAAVILSILVIVAGVVVAYYQYCRVSRKPEKKYPFLDKAKVSQVDRKRNQDIVTEEAIFRSDPKLSPPALTNKTSDIQAPRVSCTYVEDSLPFNNNYVEIDNAVILSGEESDSEWSFDFSSSSSIEGVEIDRIESRNQQSESFQSSLSDTYLD